jgi:hypothetical protein
MNINESDKRRVRFSSIQGIQRGDLPLAAEIWYSELIGQIWASRDVIKLAMLLTRYMSEPNEQLVSVNNIERSFNMDVRATLDTLRQMEMFGAIEAFSIKDNELHASLHLSLLQRVKVLETKARLLELSGADSMDGFLNDEEPDRWQPPEMTFSEIDLDEDAEPELVDAA